MKQNKNRSRLTRGLQGMINKQKRGIRVWKDGVPISIRWSLRLSFFRLYTAVQTSKFQNGWWAFRFYFCSVAHNIIGLHQGFLASPRVRVYPKENLVYMIA